MSAQVFRKYRQDSLMNEFDNIINNMDTEMASPSTDDNNEEEDEFPPQPPPPPQPPQRPTTLNGISQLSSPSEMSPPPPPVPPPRPAPRPPPRSQSVESPTLPPPPPPQGLESPTLPSPPPTMDTSPSLPPPPPLGECTPPPPPPPQTPESSLVLTPDLPPPGEDMFSPMSSNTFPDVPSDLCSPLSSPDPPPPDMFGSDNMLPSDEEEEEPVGTSEFADEEEEESASDEDDEDDDDDLDDFSGADFAIDKMLDDLKEFSLELGVDLPENKRGDFVMLSPNRERPEPPSFPDPMFNVDHLRFSIANFEDAPEVDLDALLEDLCSMERDLLLTTTSQSSSVIQDVKTDVSESEPLNDSQENNIVLAPFTPSSPTQKVPTPVMVTHDVKERLETLQTELESKELSPAEQEANIKAEKMRIALEKMKAASFQKLFIKVYNAEQQTNKTMMIDQTWTAREVKNKMMLKDDVEHGPNWCILEKLPELFMERILEDNEYVLQTVLDWSRETENVLVFLNRRDKYMLFRNPQNFLLTEKHSSQDTKLAEQSKEILLQEFFKKDSTQIPPSEGVLWLREGSKKWNKHYFVLRASGIYYNPKGKQKSRDMVCLATFEHNNIYLGVGFKKKFKAPTEHVFCLKHPKVQTIKSKHIHALCAEDAKTKEHWITVIRMAKYGYRMYGDYLQTQEELENALMHGSMHTLSSESSGVGSGSITTASTFSTDSSSTLSLNQNNKKSVAERNRNAKKTANTAPNRVAGKQNALGSIFSTAWTKGVEDRQPDYSSSSYSSITESPWMSANNSLETPSYTSGEFDFSTSQLRNSAHPEKLNGHTNGHTNGNHTNGIKNDNIDINGESVDNMLDSLSDTVSNGTTSPAPGHDSVSPKPPPPPPPEHPSTINSFTPPPTPPPCPDVIPFGDRRPPPPSQLSKPKKLQLSIPPAAPPPPPAISKPL